MTPSESLYRLIPLTQGQWAIVDVADYDWLNQWKWYALWDSNTRSFYAVRHAAWTDGKRPLLAMHREILGLRFGDGKKGDHKNHDTLDNRRVNLRVATTTQNGQNQRICTNHKTGCKGVDVKKGKYRSRIRVNGKLKSLGVFPLTPEGLESASEIYQFAADLYFGEFFCER